MKKSHQPLRGVQHLPNLLTTINLTMGIISVLLMVGDTTPQLRKVACILIFVGVLADALDGTVARLLHAESPMGKQLDSFADSITFGVAPVAILYSFPALQQKSLALVALVAYPIAGVFRLARFNLGDFKDFFLGLPITAAGALTTLYALFLSFTIDFYGAELPAFTAFLLFTLAGAMVSTLRIPRFSTWLKERQQRASS